MADRSRSRSPDREAPADDQQQPPANGDAPPADNGGAPADGGDNGGTGDEVKLYVGNLDYGKLNYHKYAFVPQLFDKDSLF
jgi:hypothetical protein